MPYAGHITKVATALTACGIETFAFNCFPKKIFEVATALTACGIETAVNTLATKVFNLLQQHLPLAVLKLLL